jgi:phospholipase D1/2
VKRVLQLGANCWKMSHSNRMAVLIDAADYYAAVKNTCEKARFAIRMLAWDFHTEMPLGPAGPDTEKLGPFLLRLVEANPQLEIHILCWAGAIIYQHERQPRAEIERFFSMHPRLHFRYTELHPPLASNHEKIVVIDDTLAFSGGIDIARDRWDTGEHLAHNPERINPLGEHYRPFHDVQMAHDGALAQVLGDLFRERWFAVTGESLKPIENAPSLWPEGLEPEFLDCDVGLSRTLAHSADAPAVVEIRDQLVDIIHAAEKYVFIECEYLTASSIVEALAHRLRQRHGPEIVIVGPIRCSGWVEESTMGSLRAQCMKVLREADRHGRLRLYYPTVPGLGNEFIYVHSKVTIADDEILHIGSANLSNRSLGVDSETDLTLELHGDEKGSAAIRRVVCRLLGEHLGVGTERFQAELEKRGSLIATVESFIGGERTLVPLVSAIGNIDWARVAVPEVVDPKYPYWWEKMVDQGDEKKTNWVVRWLPRAWPVVILLLAVALAGAWRFGPLREWSGTAAVASWLEAYRHSPVLPLMFFLAFLVGGVTFFPLLGLVAATGIFVPPPASFFVALSGSLASALASALLLYWIGRSVSGAFLQSIAGKKVELLRERLSRYGVLAITVLRLVPIVPFSIFNIVCGGLRIRLWDYLLGTLLGMLPGTLLITLVGAAADVAIRDPDPPNLLALLGLAAVAIAMAFLLSYIGTKKSRLNRQAMPIKTAS